MSRLKITGILCCAACVAGCGQDIKKPDSKNYDFNIYSSGLGRQVTVCAASREETVDFSIVFAGKSNDGECLTVVLDAPGVYEAKVEARGSGVTKNKSLNISVQDDQYPAPAKAAFMRGEVSGGSAEKAGTGDESKSADLKPQAKTEEQPAGQSGAARVEEKPAEQKSDTASKESQAEQPVEAKTEEKPAEQPAEAKTEEKPAQQPAEAKTEEKPAQQPAEAKTEEKPAEQPAEAKTEEKPAEIGRAHV